jgi:hypothetical protein
MSLSAIAPIETVVHTTNAWIKEMEVSHRS